RSSDLPPAIEVEIEPGSIPEATVDPAVAALNLDVDPSGLAVTLAENLAVEGQALREADGSLLAAVATGDRLAELQRQLDEAITTGVRRTYEHDLESVHVEVAEQAEGQSSAALTLRASGVRHTVTYDAMGNETARTSEGFSADYMLRQVAGDRWLTAAVTDR